VKRLHFLYFVLGVYVLSTSEFEEVRCCLYSFNGSMCLFRFTYK